MNFPTVPWFPVTHSSILFTSLNIFLPGEFHGQRNLSGYSPWGCKESDTTEWLTLSLSPPSRWSFQGESLSGTPNPMPFLGVQIWLYVNTNAFCAPHSSSQSPSQSSWTCSQASWGSVSPSSHVWTFQMWVRYQALHSSTPREHMSCSWYVFLKFSLLGWSCGGSTPCSMVERGWGTHSSRTALSPKNLQFLIFPKLSIPPTSPNTKAGGGVESVQAKMHSHLWKPNSLPCASTKDYVIALDLWVLQENRKYLI